VLILENNDDTDNGDVKLSTNEAQTRYDANDDVNYATVHLPSDQYASIDASTATTATATTTTTTTPAAADHYTSVDVNDNDNNNGSEYAESMFVDDDVIARENVHREREEQAIDDGYEALV
jgi:hypothetical protein